MIHLTKDTTVTVRLSSEEAEILEEFSLKNGFKNRSEAIRSLIQESNSSEKEQLTPEQKVNIDLPSKFLSDIDFLVGIDYFHIQNEALYTAIKTYLYENIDLWKIKKRAEDMKDIEFLLANETQAQLE